METQVIAGVFVAHNPSPARFTELNSSSLTAPWTVLSVFISKRHQLYRGSLLESAFVQVALAVAGGRQILGAVEGSWLVCLARSAFITVTG